MDLLRSVTVCYVLYELESNRTCSKPIYIITFSKEVENEIPFLTFHLTRYHFTSLQFVLLIDRTDHIYLKSALQRVPYHMDHMIWSIYPKYDIAMYHS